MTKTPWYYKDSPFTESMIGDAYGFVYLITNTHTNKLYYGKKFFTKAGSKQVKGKRKKIRKSSDWETYYGSNALLLEDITKFGAETCRREILKLCQTRGECAYWENYLIFQQHALLSDKYYNQWTSCKIHRSHLKLTTPPESSIL